jgi:hypothetical protein
MLKLLEPLEWGSTCPREMVMYPVEEYKEKQQTRTLAGYRQNAFNLQRLCFLGAAGLGYHSLVSLLACSQSNLIYGPVCAATALCGGFLALHSMSSNEMGQYLW